MTPLEVNSPAAITTEPLGANMKRHIQILLLLILSFNCNAQINELKSCRIVNSIFNESEIQDLETITNFFEKKICNKDSIEKCYYSFIAKLIRNEENGELFNIEIPFEEQTELYQDINKETFANIWFFQKVWTRNSADTLKSLNYNYNGKFIAFLKEYGKNEKNIEIYYQTFIASEDISPSMYVQMLLNIKEMNIKDIRNRLVIAIHYLTINDNLKRNEKY